MGAVRFVSLDPSNRCLQRTHLLPSAPTSRYSSRILILWLSRSPVLEIYTFHQYHEMAAAAPIEIAPAPWTCKCTSYVLIFFAAKSQGVPHDIAYDAVEGNAESFANASQAGAFRGGTGMIQIVRYTESPVGPYDEIVFLPGEFDTPGRKEKGVRITRIYVSQKETCYNGRRIWNIPK